MKKEVFGATGFVLSIVFLSLSAGCSKAVTAPEKVVAGGAVLQTAPMGSVQNRKYAIPSDLGAVLWSGHYSNPADAGGHWLIDGIQALGYEGFSNVRVVLAPTAPSSDYNVSNLNCPQNGFLDCVVNSPDYVTALGDPRISMIEIVTFDAITVGLDSSQRQYANTAFLNVNAAAIVSEYQNLTLSLYKNYTGTGKQFILTAWEADNELYCGSAFDFDANTTDYPTQGEGYRDWCLSLYSAFYGVASPQAGFAGYLLWMQLRQQGINQGRQLAAQQGYTNVSVKGALEFNAVVLVHEAGYPTALYNIATQSGVDLVTYSSYESINKGTLPTDSNTIFNILGKHAFAVSEFGFSPDQWGTAVADQDTANTVAQITSMHNQGILMYGTAWQAFQDDADPQFGLLTSNAVQSSVFNAYMSGLSLTANQNVNPEVPPSISSAGSGCSPDYQCAWILGDNFPQTQDLSISIRDANWNTVYTYDTNDPDVIRSSLNGISLTIPQQLQAQYHSQGLRFTVVHNGQMGWWDTTPLIQSVNAP